MRNETKHIVVSILLPLILFSGLYPIRMSVSEDDGRTWSELAPIGPFGGIVAMASVVPLRTGPGHYAAFFHDDGRFFAAKPAPTAGDAKAAAPSAGRPPTIRLIRTSATAAGALCVSRPTET